MIQIYVATNKTNGMEYVGQARDIGKRITSHWDNPPRTRKTCLEMCDALKVFGKSGFEWMHIASAKNRKDALVVEAMLIHQRRTYIPRGYNKHSGYHTLVREGVEPPYRLIETQLLDLYRERAALGLKIPAKWAVIIKTEYRKAEKAS